MFDRNGPFDPDLCNEILIEVAKKRKSRETAHLARIKCIAEEFGYERLEVKNNADYLADTGFLKKRIGGFLKLTRKGAFLVNNLLEDI